MRAHFATVDEILEEARNGRMFILVGGHDGEGGGDLVLPAQMVTPNAINFMAHHGRGIVCLALTAERVKQLSLSPMVPEGKSSRETGFTVSIEARQGVSTGISAADRAHTIAVAINAANSTDAITTPGHVFPLRARDGGVLVRAGYTEAAVDIARLAGLNASAAICKIMNDDGDIASLGDLAQLARAHDLKIGSISDLIAYRRRHDHLVSCRNETHFSSHHGGDWTLKIYANTVDGSEHLILQKGQVDPAVPTLVRMHVLSAFSDVLAERNERTGQLHRAMDVIGERGSGVIVALRDIVRTPLSEMIDRHRNQLGSEIKDYGIGAQILVDLGVTEMEVLTNSMHSYLALEGYDLKVVAYRPL